MARTQDVVSGVFAADQAQCVSEETYIERTRRAEPVVGDLLYSREGTYFGMAAEVPAGRKVCLGQRMVLLRPSRKSVSAGYLRYWLNSGTMQRYIHGFRDGSVAERLNLPTIRRLPVVIPRLPEQRRIARVLGALDDKIELNREMNETLEEMARALFKSWFVDFDPVRAKMEGRQPYGMDADTAALFPDSFEDSALGPIPKGWAVGTLMDLLTLQRGFDLPKGNRVAGSVPIVAAGGLNGRHNEAKVMPPGVVTGRSGKLGNVFLVLDAFWPLNTTLWVKSFSRSAPHHAYHLLKTLELERFNAGSAVPTLNRNHVHNLPLVLPDVRVVYRFEKSVGPMFARRHQSRIESRTLAELRDTLLPKLLSGEVRVPEAEEMVEAS